MQQNEDQQTKKYNLVMPMGLANEIQSVANKEQVSFVIVLRQFLKLGLALYKMKETNTRVIIQEPDGQQTQLLITF